ncbi:hypothetical protein [Intestinibacter sp.]|uniref:hypothetical protein n=1 Tax=Intestinibacter sp. TaxID=1965304 RepID=UPI003F15F77D
MSKLDERINKRLNKKLNRRKKVFFLKVISFTLMICISVVCIFWVDYNMNEMLNKRSLIENYLPNFINIEF